VHRPQRLYNCFHRCLCIARERILAATAWRPVVPSYELGRLDTFFGVPSVNQANRPSNPVTQSLVVESPRPTSVGQHEDGHIGESASN
jgi:hypothetical protein